MARMSHTVALIASGEKVSACYCKATFGNGARVFISGGKVEDAEKAIKGIGNRYSRSRSQLHRPALLKCDRCASAPAKSPSLVDKGILVDICFT